MLFFSYASLNAKLMNSSFLVIGRRSRRWLLSLEGNEYKLYWVACGTAAGAMTVNNANNRARA